MNDDQQEETQSTQAPHVSTASAGAAQENLSTPKAHQAAHAAHQWKPGVPRYKQKYEHLHVNYVRPGVTKEFSGACRDRGVKCYAVIERLIDGWIAGKFEVL